MGDDRDLGTEPGLTCDGLDLDRAVIDLGHLQLEESPNEPWMAAGEDDLRPVGGVADAHDVGTDPLAQIVLLVGDAFTFRKYGFSSAQVDDQVASIEADNVTRQNIAFAVLVILKDLIPFGLADALEHCLFRRLRGDSAEIGRGDLHLDVVADLRIRCSLNRFVQGDLSMLVADVLDHAQSGECFYVSGFGVKNDAQVPRGAYTLFAGGQNRILDRFDQDLPIDPFFLFVIVQDS